MNETSSKNEITSGIIWKQLLLFFFPILLGSFFQQLYNTIDAVIVGRFVGKNALAAVAGSSGMVINLLVNFFTGLTAGASVIVSQFFGSGDRKKVDDSIHTIYAFSIIGSVIMTLIGITAAPALLRLMNTPEELMSDSILYLRIYFAGIFFVFIYNTGAGLLRALGDSRRPLYCLMICCVINIVLDLLLIVGLGLGVAGAAIATLLSQGISAVIVTVFLMRQKDLCDFSLKDIRIHPRLLKSELLLGLPVGFQYAMYSISNMIIQSALNKFGTDTVAAWAAYGKLDAIVWMVSGAFGIAITTFVGQNYGAGKYDRVRKSIRVCIGMDFAAAILLMLVLVCFRIPLFHIENDGDHGSVLLAVRLYRGLLRCAARHGRCRRSDAHHNRRYLPVPCGMDFRSGCPLPDAHRNAPQLSGVLGFNIRSVSVLLSFPDEEADHALIAPASLTSLCFLRS